MDFLKKLELELMRDWRNLQLETVPELKTRALSAYYRKLERLKRLRNWSIEVGPPGVEA